MQKIYWVGDRPGGNWTFTILDQRAGTPVNLSVYNKVSMVVLDPRNKQVDIPDTYTAVTSALDGQVQFLWPQDSIFTIPGRYVMQIKLESPTATRLTTVQEILVRKPGGVVN
jgi:hypothetical protein